MTLDCKYAALKGYNWALTLSTELEHCGNIKECFKIMDYYLSSEVFL